MSIYVKVSLTVYYEKPYWVGVVERFEGDSLSVSRIVFGPEPKDYEVYEFMEKNYFDLKFSLPIENDKYTVKKRKINPKRLQRMVKKEVGSTGIRTKAQEAINLQRELSKIKRKAKSKAEREAEKQLKFHLKQKKKKEKHKGH